MTKNTALRRATHADDNTGAQEIRALFIKGHFPVLTVNFPEDPEKKPHVLGLVVARGYDAEEVFFSMLSRAHAKGANCITGYREDVAFHPDGSRFYTCYGTVVHMRKA